MDVYMKSTEQHLDGALNRYDNFDGDIHLIGLRDGHLWNIMVIWFVIKLDYILENLSKTFVYQNNVENYCFIMIINMKMIKSFVQQSLIFMPLIK